MTTRSIPNNIELNKIIYPRLSPYVWDVIGYSGGLVAIFYYDKVGIIVYACSFVLYGLLNAFFDISVVSFEYSNNVMPNYKSIGNYNFYITNKKYILQNINKSKPLDAINMVDDSKLKIELSIYVGECCVIKYLLFFIYLFGITKKNYTMNDYNAYKDTICRFV
jgi:hypothetical protein